MLYLVLSSNPYTEDQYSHTGWDQKSSNIFVTCYSSTAK